MASLSVLISVTIISRLCLIASDTLVVVVTWWYLWGTLRVSGGQRSPSALVVLLLIDSEQDALIGSLPKLSLLVTDTIFFM